MHMKCVVIVKTIGIKNNIVISDFQKHFLWIIIVYAGYKTQLFNFFTIDFPLSW